MAINRRMANSKLGNVLVVKVVWNHQQDQGHDLKICDECVGNIHEYCLEKGIQPPRDAKVFYVPLEWERTKCIHEGSYSYQKKIVVPYNPEIHGSTRG